jgi:STE24 endopeptidase
MLAAALLARRVARDELDGPGALPALALAVIAISTPITAISNQLSRRIEARADSYALELTDAPQPFVDFEKRITLRNISEPDPPGWARALFGTHPTTLQRIGAAEAFRDAARRAGRPIRGGS